MTIQGNVTAGGRPIDSTAGPLNWTGGRSGHAQRHRGTRTSGLGDKYLSGCTINQAGTTTWTGTGTSYLDNASLFNNLVGSTFDVQTDALITRAFASTATFDNAGTFKKSAGSGTTTMTAASPSTTRAVSTLRAVRSASIAAPGVRRAAIPLSSALGLDHDLEQPGRQPRPMRISSSLWADSC